jgi:hypothetical protein
LSYRSAITLTACDTERFFQGDGKSIEGEKLRVYHYLEALSKLLYLESNDLDDVREEWERIKLSYEILRDNKTRRRFDRHEMVADPGAAMRRAAFEAATKGAVGVGKGLFNLGNFAVQQLSKNKDEQN